MSAADRVLIISAEGACHRAARPKLIAFAATCDWNCAIAVWKTDDESQPVVGSEGYATASCAPPPPDTPYVVSFQLGEPKAGDPLPYPARCLCAVCRLYP